MKKIFLPLLAILLFTACQKQVSTDKTSEEIVGAAPNKQTKFTVCHYDVVTGISKTIEVTQNALAGHLAHGDLQGDCSTVLTTICNQDWMVKNLDVSTYRNGDPIPQVTDPSAWAGLTTGAWCYYDNNPANGANYGKLYNWYAVHDSRNIAPVGWHVSTDAEWIELATCLGGESVAGDKLKEAGTAFWQSPNTGSTNSSGFTGRPGGIKDEDGTYGNFTAMGLAGYWWSSVPNGWILHNGQSLLQHFSPYTIRWGLSVRCVRD